MNLSWTSLNLCWTFQSLHWLTTPLSATPLAFAILRHLQVSSLPFGQLPPLLHTFVLASSPLTTFASWISFAPSSGFQAFWAYLPLGHIATLSLRGLPISSSHYHLYPPLCLHFGHDPILIWYVINVIVWHVLLLLVLTLTYSGTPLSLPFVIPLSTATVVLSISRALM